jgi:hypothetical protein
MKFKTIQAVFLSIALGSVASAQDEGISLFLYTRGGGPPSPFSSGSAPPVPSFSGLDGFSLIVSTPTPQYTISTASDPTAGGSTKGGGTTNDGASVTVKATPAKGYSFVNWTVNGAFASTNNPWKLDPDVSETVAANFGFAVTGTVSPAGTGTISGKGIYTPGSLTTLTAVPDPCFEFSKWMVNGKKVTANPYIFTVTNNVSFVADFTQIQYTVTTVTSGTNEGTISGAGLKECGAKVTLTATPKAGFKFVEWIDLGSTEPVFTNKATFSFDIDSDRSFQAIFKDIKPPTLTVSSPTPGETVAKPTLTISGTATDNVAVKYVAYSLNGGDWVQLPAGAKGVWSNNVILKADSANSLWVFASDTGGNLTGTNKLTIHCTAAGYAPASLSGMVGKVSLAGQSPFEISFGANTFAQSEYGTNQGSGVGLYTYMLTNANVANLNLDFTAPAGKIGDGGAITFTFVDPFTAEVADSDNDTGTIIFSSTQDLAPASLAGLTTVFTSGSQPGYSDTNEFLKGGFSAADSTSNVYSGTYSFTQFSPVAVLVQQTITEPLGYLGASNIILMTYGGTVGSNNYAYTGYASSGSPEMESGTFENSGKLATNGFAPASLAGLEWRITPTGRPAYTVSFGTETFGTTSGNTNYYGVASYTYTLLGPNTASLSWTYLAPYDQLSGFTPSAATVTFTKAGSALFSNNDVTETGNVTSSAAPTAVPVTFAGKTLTASFVKRGVTESGVIAFSNGKFTADNTPSGPGSFGPYTFTPISQNIALVQLTYEDAADAGLVEYLELTFTTPTSGTFVALHQQNSETSLLGGTFSY